MDDAEDSVSENGSTDCAGLKYLAEQGLIELKRGKIVIVDHERLEKYNN